MGGNFFVERKATLAVSSVFIFASLGTNCKYIYCMLAKVCTRDDEKQYSLLGLFFSLLFIEISCTLGLRQTDYTFMTNKDYQILLLSSNSLCHACVSKFMHGGLGLGA